MDGIESITPVIAPLVKADSNLAVILLGSRAKGLSKKYSDWDIGITCGESELATEKYLRLKNMVDELSENIPHIVDLVNLDSAPPWFLEKINYEPIFLDGKRESFAYFKGVLNGVKK